MPRNKSKHKQTTGSRVHVHPDALIQEIITQRKAEAKIRAQERRQRDIQRIQEMRSNTGVDPLEIFPKEIWEVILEKLPPVDKGNISGVHNLFNNLLENTRIRDILLPQMVGMNVTGSDAFHLAKRYSFLRGVSKSLRDAVDRFHEAYFLNHMRTDLLAVRHGVDLSAICLEYVMPNIVEKYFRGEEKNTSKRFFTRSLLLQVGTSRRFFGPYRDELITFLEQVGDQIWYLQYCCYDDTSIEDEKMSIGQAFIEFNKFLEYMPNLKWLKLQLQMAPQKQNSVRKMLKDFTPLKLHHLERIDFASESGNAESIEIFEAVLMANSHIKILHLICLEAPISSTIVKSLPSLEVIQPWRPRNSRTGLDCMRRFVNQNWPLKRVELEESASSLNWVFRFLEKFPTLEFLSLALDDLLFPREVFYLRLPNLTEMKLYVTHRGDETCFRSRGAQFFLSLQFLLYVPKLKSLLWMLESANLKKLREKLERDMCFESSGGIDFCGGWKDLRDSNIWDIFPDLEQVDVHLDKMDRVQVEARMYIRKYCRRTLIWQRIWPEGTKIDEHF